MKVGRRLAIGLATLLMVTSGVASALEKRAYSVEVSDGEDADAIADRGDLLGAPTGRIRSGAREHARPNDQLQGTVRRERQAYEWAEVRSDGLASQGAA